LNQTQQRSFAEVVDFGAAIWKIALSCMNLPVLSKKLF
jgi:hypothetical protein